MTQGFRRHCAARNAIRVRIAAVLAIVFFSIFWILDWFIIPDFVGLSFFLRAVCCGYAAILLFLSYKKKQWVRRYHWELVAILAASITGSISVMCWVHRGLESPYYAGIGMVMIVIGMMFSWTRKQALILNGLVYGFYVFPFLLGIIKSQQLPILVSNQFFLLSLMLLPAISQQHRVKMEAREFKQRKTLKTYLAQVRMLASKDMLTGLNNRRQLMILGEHALARCTRYRRPFSVVLIDIDWFKKINDTYSHRVGDEVIVRVAQILLSNIRSIDIIGRYGGEEFLILLPETEPQNAARWVARRVHRAVRESKIPTSVGPLSVTISLGVAGKKSESIPLATLVDRADSALYRAKGEGRDRIFEWRDRLCTRKAA